MRCLRAVWESSVVIPTNADIRRRIKEQRRWRGYKTGLVAEIIATRPKAQRGNNTGGALESLIGTRGSGRGFVGGGNGSRAGIQSPPAAVGERRPPRRRKEPGSPTSPIQINQKDGVNRRYKLSVGLADAVLRWDKERLAQAQPSPAATQAKKRWQLVKKKAAQVKSAKSGTAAASLHGLLSSPGGLSAEAYSLALLADLEGCPKQPEAMPSSPYYDEHGQPVGAGRKRPELQLKAGWGDLARGGLVARAEAAAKVFAQSEESDANGQLTRLVRFGLQARTCSARKQTHKPFTS